MAANPDAAPWPELPPILLQETATGDAPQQATWFKTAHDRETLRILFWMEDTHPWATLGQRDSPLYEEEVVEVFLDPAGDLQSYFEFEVNPLNTVLDLVIYREEKTGCVKDFHWRCEGLQTAVQRTPVGWCAEFSIPFASLNAAPQGNWRANFYRIDRPIGEPAELSAWSPTGQRQFHFPARFGLLAF